MGNKTTKVEIKDAKVKTPFGKCGVGSCKSTCCETPDDDTKDAHLLYIEKAIQFELKTLEKMLLEKMIESLKVGNLPQINIIPTQSSFQIDLQDEKKEDVEISKFILNKIANTKK